ncbi:hypothetical protein HDV01_001524 [Terramyces sp. JEL0728]|nr:hypothetical protein HDV01_001524 [Terramyces sp. JEL0728]
MEAIYKESLLFLQDFIDKQLLVPSTRSRFSVIVDTRLWDWNQLSQYHNFKWDVARTPLASLGVITVTWAIYFSTILLLKAFMANREPFKLLWITAFHNLLLCAESFFMFVVGSSILTLKNVIFLHWYHHAIVMLMVWAWMEFNIPFGIFGLILNTGIHVLMYWYYFASSFGWNVWYKKYITTAQIVQFITSFVMSIPYIYYAKLNDCGGWNAYYFSMAVSGSFLILFVNFYRKSYLKKPKAVEKKEEKKERKNYSPSASPRAKRTPKKK